MRFFRAGLSAFLLVFSSFLFAHPHSWVNLTSDFVIDENNQLVEVRQRWIFDAFYSALTLDDLRKQFPSDDIGLRVFGDDVVNNMASVNYFSNLSQAGKIIPLGLPYKWHFSTFKLGDEELLVAEMLFRVSNTPLLNASIEWSVYDPTYYVDMRHDDIEKIRIINLSTSECQPELLEPDPTDDQIMYAASLDKTQTNSTGLGQIFAQKVTLSCF